MRHLPLRAAPPHPSQPAPSVVLAPAVGTPWDDLRDRHRQALPERRIDAQGHVSPDELGPLCRRKNREAGAALLEHDWIRLAQGSCSCAGVVPTKRRKTAHETALSAAGPTWHGPQRPAAQELDALHRGAAQGQVAFGAACQQRLHLAGKATGQRVCCQGRSGSWGHATSSWPPPGAQVLPPQQS